MSRLGVNEKDLGIKEAGLPCLTVFSRDVLVLLRTWRRASFGLPFWLSWVVHTRPLNWKKTSATEAFEIHEKKKLAGLWGKMKSFSYMVPSVDNDGSSETCDTKTLAYGGSDESFWSKPTAPTGWTLRHSGPLQAYILGVIERSGGIFGRKLKERDWGPKLAGRKTQLHIGQGLVGLPDHFPIWRVVPNNSGPMCS